MRIPAIFSVFVAVSTWASHPAAAAPTVPDLAYAVKGATVEITPPKAHHFNVDAPADVRESGKPLVFKLEETRLAVTLPQGPAERVIDAQVFVCDDAKTFCLKKKQSFRLTGASGGGAPAKPGRKEAAPAPATKPQAYTEPATGFIVNDPDQAFKLAAERKLPLMIDFFGIWCPPCNHLDAMVLRNAKFKARNGKRFVRLKLDADQEAFNELKSRYRVQGLPTVVFTTPGGDEIFRVLGFRPLEEMMAKADAAYASREVGYAELAARAGGVNPEAQYKAARIALDRDEPEQALRWLEPLEELFTRTRDPRLSQLHRARSLVAQKKGDKDAIRSSLNRWIKDFPDSPDALESLQALAELESEAGNQDAARAALKSAIALTDKLLANHGKLLKGSYYTRADVAQTRAGLYEELGDADHAKGAYLLCAEAHAQEARAEGKDFARGPSLERAYCLGKAGRFAESEAIYRQGIRLFPTEYTFHQGLAKLLLETGKEPARALEASERALKHAYGSQRLKATLTQVKALEALKDTPGAIQALDRVLDVPLPEGSTQSTLRLRQKLESKREELKKKSST